MKDKIRNSLKFSFLDGTFFSVMFGFGDSYFNPFAIALKATNFQIGLLSSLPGLISSLFQIRAPDWTEKIGRSKIMNAGVFVQSLMWLPIILCPFILPSNPATFLILAVTIYQLSVSLAAPAWSSIMCQYLPYKKRGAYFSWRQRTHGTFALVSTFAAGYILYLFPRQSINGFILIFSIAMICRFLSWYYVTRMYEPKLWQKPESFFTFREFIARARESNFVKFVLFAAGISFSVNFCAPFFSVYMLRELKFDYLSYVIIISAATVATLFSLQAWGRHTDKAGCLRVMHLTSLIIPTLPILWIFSSAKIYLIAIQILSGFAWGGFNLAVSNFIYDSVSETKRVRCISYFNLINGLGLFLGASLGGYLISRMPPIFGNKILTIFLISGLMRILVRFTMLPKLREVRKVDNITNSQLFFSVTGVKPLSDTARQSLTPE